MKISSRVIHCERKMIRGEITPNDCSGTFEFGWTRS
jgi:hypothetical protein